MSTFKFTSDDKEHIHHLLAKYPKERSLSCIIPILWIAQRRNNNWLSDEAIHASAAVLQIPPIKAYEVVSFYTMFRTYPVGRYHIQICGTTSCFLHDSHSFIDICQQKIGDPFKKSSDGLFSWEEVECLGLCHYAAAIHINETILCNITNEDFEDIMHRLTQQKENLASLKKKFSPKKTSISIGIDHLSSVKSIYSNIRDDEC